MADVKLGEPFGMDAGALAAIDFDLSVQRILNDVKSDFIYAPHLSLIYAKAGDALKKMVHDEISNGNFRPGIPISIEVPKSFRIMVESTKRLGPTYSRPGSILMPKDRLLYQALADEAIGIIDNALDHQRSFSHQSAYPGSPTMFLPTRQCWSDLQASLALKSKLPGVQYVLKIDIANFFSSLNLHTLINVLNDSGFQKAYSSRLEALLSSFTGERSSRGILQGIYPSDLFGNFYLAPIDRLLKDMNVPSSRYVDDIYLFVDSVDHAERVLRELIPALRGYDLSLNESKCKILPKSLLHALEPDLDALFEAAVAEISEQVEDDDFDTDYGFQSEWENDDDDDDKDDADADPIELAATLSLFNSVNKYPGQEENVERFCLPLFSKAASDAAVDHVKDAFRRRPAMSQIYCAYLARFIANRGVRSFLGSLVADDTLMDWQRMWVLAAMMMAPAPTDDEVKLVLDIARDGTRHDVFRAVAVYFVGRYGDYPRRTALRTNYAQYSNYVQSAIYASSRFWPPVERANAKATWGGHGELHSLITEAMKKSK